MPKCAKKFNDILGKFKQYDIVMKETKNGE